MRTGYHGMVVLLWITATGGSLTFAARQSSPGSAVTPVVEVLVGDGSPIRVESARMHVSDDQLTISLDLSNPSTISVIRAQATLLVYGANGLRTGVQVEEAPQEILPINGGTKVTFAFAIRAAVQDGDRLRLAISEAATVSSLWVYEGLLEEADARIERPPQMPSPEAEVFIVNSDDAPAEIIGVQAVKTPTGTIAVVHVTVRNRQQEPVTALRIDALVFDEKGAIRMQSFGRDIRPLAPAGLWSHDIVVNNALATKGWRVAVAVQMANTTSVKWTSDHLREKALAALHAK